LGDAEGNSNTSSGEEVKNEQHEGNDQEEMNQSAGDMESKSTSPKENEHDCDNQ